MLSPTSVRQPVAVYSVAVVVCGWVTVVPQRARSLAAARRIVAGAFPGGALLPLRTPAGGAWQAGPLHCL